MDISFSPCFVIHCYHLTLVLRLPQIELLEALSGWPLCLLTVSSTLPHILAQQDVPGSSCAFTALALEPAVSLRRSGSFSRKRHLEARVCCWVCSRLLRCHCCQALDGQNWNICTLTHTPTVPPAPAFLSFQHASPGPWPRSECRP